MDRLRHLLCAGLLVGCGASSTAPRAVPPPANVAAAATSCVEPVADTRARLLHDDDSGEVHELAIDDAGFDADGDGANEELVDVVDWAGVTGNRTAYLYLSGRGCPRFAAVVFGESLNPLDTVHEGVRDLSTYADGGCASMEGNYDVLVFDGAAYVPDPAQAVSCACPDDDHPDPTRDPRCPGYE